MDDDGKDCDCSTRKKLSLKCAKQLKLPLSPSNCFNTTIGEEELAQSFKSYISADTTISTGWATTCISCTVTGTLTKCTRKSTYKLGWIAWATKVWIHHITSARLILHTKTLGRKYLQLCILMVHLPWPCTGTWLLLMLIFTSGWWLSSYHPVITTILSYCFLWHTHIVR